MSVLAPITTELAPRRDSGGGRVSYMCGQEDQGPTTDQQTQNNCVWQLNKCKYLCRVFSNALVVGCDEKFTSMIYI